MGRLLWRLLQGFGLSLDVREGLLMMAGSSIFSAGILTFIWDWFSARPILIQVLLVCGIVLAIFAILGYLYQWVRRDSKLEIQFGPDKDGCIHDGVVGGVENSESRNRSIWIFNHDKRQEAQNVKVRIIDISPNPPGLQLPFLCRFSNRGWGGSIIEPNDKGIVQILMYTRTPSQEKMVFLNNNGLEYSVPVNSYMVTLQATAKWRLSETKDFVVGFSNGQFIFIEDSKFSE